MNPVVKNLVADESAGKVAKMKTLKEDLLN
jgi:hypothetical protein